MLTVKNVKQSYKPHFRSVSWYTEISDSALESCKLSHAILFQFRFRVVLACLNIR